uniref:BZIP domain-containing protein n=1 Tax=Caenorhabditis japonica TaxID=281687 RepID=A0A8R1HN16_CAEJA
MSAGSSFSTALGDYDLPVEESFTAKLSPCFPFSFPSFPLASSSRESIESEESEDELVNKKPFGFMVSPNFDLGSNMSCEEEKKRLRNTEAARRCREKIKKKTKELEEDLSTYLSKNAEKNRQRIRLLSQIEEQIRMLHIVKENNPLLIESINTEAESFVRFYMKEIKRKRQTISEYYSHVASKSF